MLSGVYGERWGLRGAPGDAPCNGNTKLGHAIESGYNAPLLRPAMSTALDKLIEDGRELLRRLLPLVPAGAAVDWSRVHAARWHRQPLFGGRLEASGAIDPIALDELLCIDLQRDALIRNTRQLLAGAPANHALLWGARGTGKSSLVHALLNRFAAHGLRLVEVDKHDLGSLAELARHLAGEPYRFVLFCDDLSFEAEESEYKALKSALEGSVFTTASNLVIYATSNRRHLLPESMADNQASRLVDGELHHGEAVEEKISLSDRFGLWLSFYPFRQDDYLAVARLWVDRLGARHGVAEPWDDAARAEALRWALARGVRSGRTAQHFARHWIGSRLLEDS